MTRGSPDLSGLDDHDLLEFDRLCDDFQAGWSAGKRPAIETYLAGAPSRFHHCLLRELLALEVEARLAAGEVPNQTEYLVRFPSFAELVPQNLPTPGEQQKPDEDQCQNTTPPQPLLREDDSDCPADLQLPRKIGRYKVERLLGHGSFGLVYLAHDDQLQRLVAIKVPHRKLVSKPEDAQAYLAEARTVAKLDHPNIVPVHDVGATDEFPCYVVSKYIDGTDLSTRLKQSSLSNHESVELVATVAEALHHAHKQGIVHRDVKPGNILLDKNGKPFVADFGLALREQDVGKGPRYVGTPAYMSPEQAGCEGHRVDGRSDIFSLGIVFYQLLTGRRPFKGDSQDELIEQITSFEARPPRQIDDRIPKELDRICLKALSKRATERYSAARDMADDLRHFLASASPADRSTVTGMVVKGNAEIATPVPAPTTASASASQPVKIVPKGLRSFDGQDADFFLELLAGPRDREGLPDSIRFWKSRIEVADPDNTFSVGLIYGPSGCGKSSLIKGGLLPRLSTDIIAVYVEATTSETESRLLNALRKRCLGLPATLSLVETLAVLRRQRGVHASKKVLIVLDQFEQWLHAKKEKRNPELVQALRQCDGGHLQCVVLVRDDFWLAVSRFMRDLDIDLVPGRNIALVDLFDLDHARKVLAAFGRAFGRLPERPQEMSKEQSEFLKKAISGLSQENKVVCVRLALFAEMMKGRPWTVAALREDGGMHGVGVAFLEDTFSGPTANPKHRVHQHAARAVLKMFLPESSRDIKGNMRSEADLLTASGYANHRKDFDELIQILDGEVRLLTPTDPEGRDEGDRDAIEPEAASDSSVKYYQLTHDYLIRSLRDWLTRKQMERLKGRMELRLAERAVLWNEKPERRYLPSLPEWAGIRSLTQSRDWTRPQRKMMRRADRYHASRSLLVLACLAFLYWGVREYTAQMEARSLRNSLLATEIAGVPEILSAIEPQRSRVTPLLQEAFAKEKDRKIKLKLSLALVQSDANQVEYLYEELLHSAPEDFVVIRGVLKFHKNAALIDRLWTEFADVRRGRDRRFRAACALVEFAPREGERWRECAAYVVDGLVAESPLVWIHWKAALAPVQHSMLPALAATLEEGKWTAPERLAITDFYRDFASNVTSALEPLKQRLYMERTGLAGPDLARRRATIAAALAALGNSDEIWPLLVHRPVPTLRSYLIERLGTSGIDPRILKKLLVVETNVSIRRALILALGGFPANQLPELGPILLELYEHDPDAGIHAASRWALRHWNRADHLALIDEKLALGYALGGRGWYVAKRQPNDRFTITFTVLEGPYSLVSGTEKNVQPSTHRFAMAATEVTMEQFRSFKPGHLADQKVITPPDSPAGKVSWFHAVEFCNWLSDRDGIPPDQWCYRKEKGGNWDVFPDYLKRSGYRLPTEQEWAFACLAGAQTQWHFGEANRELASYYAWFDKNAENDDGFLRSQSVARLKPNDFGLFDMHGNLLEWCHVSRPMETNTFDAGVMLGGDYLHSFGEMSCDKILTNPRVRPLPTLGFRVARTLPPK